MKISYKGNNVIVDEKRISFEGKSILEDIYYYEENGKYFVEELSEKYVYSDFGCIDLEKCEMKEYESVEEIVKDFVDNYMY